MALILRVFVILVALVLQSCKEEQSSSAILKIASDQLVQNFTTQSGSKTLDVNSNQKITAVSSDIAWCTTQISTVDGNDQHRLTINVTENTDPKERKAVVKVSADGITPIDIHVTQIGTDPVILVKDAEKGIVIEGDNAEFTLEISTNIELAFELPEWITKKEPKAVSTQQYGFVAGVMPQETSERTFTMKIKAAQDNIDLDDVSVVVTQKQKKVEYPRFVIMSENHFDRESAGTDAVSRAKKVLSTLLSKTPLVDAIFIPGDHTDRGTDAQYASMLSVFKNTTYLPSEVLWYPMLGNHDYYTGSIEESQTRFKTNFGLTSIHQYIEIKGYSFITISLDQSTKPWYTQQTKDFVKASLADAAAKHPGQPIFLFTHVPMANTVVASEQGTDELSSILNNYPQVVIFTGHTHHSIADPRSIDQDYFTAINDGSAWYSEVESGMVGGIEPVGHDQVLEGLIATVKDNGDVVVERWDLFRNEEIMPQWTIRAPHDGSAFQYKNLTGGTIPAFESGQKPIVMNITENGCKVEWKKASDDDRVYSYLVEVLNNSNQVVNSSKIFSFFIWNSDTPTTLKADVSNLELKVEYSIRVTAIDAYGQKSTPIQSDKFTTKEYTPDPSTKVPTADLVDVIFTPSGAVDISPLKHVLEPGTKSSQGVPSIAFNATQNNYIGTFNAGGETNYKLWYKDNKTLKDAFMKSFTMEVYYKALKTGQAPFGAQQQGAFGIEHNGNTPVLWIFLGGSYKTHKALTALNTTDFYHVVFTYDKSVGKVTCFINGKPSGETTVSGDMTFPTNDQAHWLAIGGDCNAYPTLDYPFDGQITFARMYSKAVNLDEVILLYRQIKGRASLTKMADVNDLLKTIISKIATATSSDKILLEGLLNEGFKIVGNYSTTSAQIEQYITKVNTQFP